MTIRKTLPVILIPAAMFFVLFRLLVTAAPSANAAPALHEGASPSLSLAPASTIRYVSPTGNDGGDCTSATSPCRTVQHAVDQAASGDEIRIATGSYTDIHVRNSIAQIVYISKTVTLRGGYSADFGAWDPAQYTTTLDAQSAGRVLYISGDITPTVEGLTLINGDTDEGGGVYIITATATISACRIVSNTAFDHGGGLYLWHSDATLMNNTISGNAAFNYGGGVYLYYSNATLMNNTISGNTAWDGGGLYLYHSDATLTGNTISGDTASDYGGGLNLHYSNATLTGNTIISNTASDYGGGLELYYSNATLTGNTISGNTATYYDGGGLRLEGSDATLTGNTIVSNTAGYNGGGLYLGSSDATLTGNTIINNTATRSGGGLYLLSSDADLQNDIVADNAAGNDGGGLYIEGSSPVLRHLTLARNRGNAGVSITEYDGWGTTYSHVVLTDTILVNHTVGINVTSGNTATLEATLWANGTDWGGTGTITTGEINLWGDPRFVDPDAGDYHILATSAAVDAGVDVGITNDIDGDPRPVAFGYDIGADEVLNGPALQPAKESAGQFYNPGETVTYTIRVPNNGIATAVGVRITDTLPATQRPQSVATSPSSLACTVASAWGGTVVCGPTEIPAGTTVLITLTAQVTTTFSDDAALPMENHLEAQGSNAAAETALRLYLHNCHVRINNDTTEYHSVQQAVDTATDGDLLKIAGLCADVHARNGVSQVAYIGKTITIRGGYRTDFGAWDPAQYTTTLDARGAGRVLCITGDISPTVEGLTLINGDATGLGGLSWWGDAGGGVYIITATPTISACRISGNTSPDHGGGLYLYHSGATLTDNTIVDNTSRYGGGVSLDGSDATLTGNTISGNSGGGLDLVSSDALLMGNQISGNIGNGLHLVSSDATLTDNIIASNTAGYNGGGLYLWNSDATLRGNTIVGNTTSQDGGGLYLCYNSDADLQNDIIADNVAGYYGGGLYVAGSSPLLRHLTLARNRGSAGVYVTEYNGWMGEVTYSHVAMTDTILVSHTVGVHVNSSNSAALQATLWGSGAWANGTDWGGAGTITTGTVNVRGDPVFVGPYAGNYHIQPPSAAVDAGVDAGVTSDIDGDARPYGNGYDIGADEYVRHPLTTVTINGPTSGATDIPYTFAAVIPPDDGTPPITYTWMPSPQDGQGTETATYTWATTGTHTITVTAENYGGVATATHTIVLAQKHALYLPLVLRGQ